MVEGWSTVGALKEPPKSLQRASTCFCVFVCVFVCSCIIINLLLPSSLILHATQAMHGASLSRANHYWKLDLLAKEKELERREKDLIARENRCRTIERRAKRSKGQIERSLSPSTSNTSNTPPVLQERRCVFVCGINVWTSSCDEDYEEDSPVDNSTEPVGTKESLSKRPQ